LRRLSREDAAAPVTEWVAAPVTGGCCGACHGRLANAAGCVVLANCKLRPPPRLRNGLRRLSREAGKGRRLCSARKPPSCAFHLHCGKGCGACHGKTLRRLSRERLRRLSREDAAAPVTGGWQTPQAAQYPQATKLRPPPRLRNGLRRLSPEDAAEGAVATECNFQGAKREGIQRGMLASSGRHLEWRVGSMNLAFFECIAPLQIPTACLLPWQTIVGEPARRSRRIFAEPPPRANRPRCRGVGGVSRKAMPA
jgi:hypothetical protein